jgi:hypothetical protein
MNHVLHSSTIGLARRLRWFISVLPHTSGMQGQFLNCGSTRLKGWNSTQVFYFIRPTSTNFQAYERWSGTEMQSNVWLGDMVDEVVKVTLHAGNTMIIPTGWIHAVVSPNLIILEVVEN